MERRRPRGELRDRILDATAQLIADRGDPAAVSIDDVVTSAGCTPPSLYYYFPTKQHLVHAACRRAYEQFAADIEASLPSGSAREELAARGRAYLDWAIAHPGLYRALFLERPPTPAQPEPSSTDPRSSAGLAELVDNVERAMAANVIRRSDALSTAFALWATVHGVASLAVTNPDLPRALIQQTLDTTMTAVLEHLAP